MLSKNSKLSCGDQRRRLVIVVPHHWAVNCGGAEYQVQQLTEQLLLSNRYDIAVIARVAPPRSLWNGVEVIGIADSPDRPRLGYLADTLPLYRALKRINPDVIYQRVGCGYTAIAANYARRHDVPMIWHASSDTDVSSAVLIGGTNVLTRMLEKHSVEYGIRNASKIICQTREQTRLLHAHYGRQADTVVPNFHPLPSESLDKSGPTTVLWIANLKRLKQPEIFVRLAASLSDLQQVRFVMMGTPPVASRRDGYWRDRLLSRIHSTPNLQYVGRQTQEQVNSWLASSHLLVSTSLQEGFPNTFIQAWMRAVPVVSLKINPDGVLDREPLGFCAETEDELVRAVRSLLQENSRLVQYGEAARTYAFAHHSLRNVQQIEQLICESLANRS